MTDKARERKVIVVGAGPVGMTAALALCRRGIPVTILEAEPEGRIRPGSRAIFTHRASLQALEAVTPGLGWTLAGEGIVWPVKRTLFRGREVYVKHYPPPDPTNLPPFSSLPQVRIEAHMYQACQAAGVEFVWATPVEGVAVDDAGVSLATSRGPWRAAYVVGADGARSTVRKALGIGMQGSRSANTFIVVDVAENPDNPLPFERRFHYQHPAMGYRNVLFVPFAGGWRVDLQLLTEDEPARFGSDTGVRGWLARVMPEYYRDRVTWVSSYQFLQVVADRFVDTHRRVALVGEAAHLFAPFGARGMNSGIVDAIEAAEAIRVALGGAPEESQGAFDRFAARRQTAARYNRDAAGIALEHIQGQNPTLNLKRHVAAWVAPWSRRAGRWLDEGPYGPKSGPPELATKY